MLGGLAVLSSCGARTGLPGGSDPCNEEGERRTCYDPCGEGVQICEDGFFGVCEVPIETRACKNDCGDGMQTCEAGAWSACQVPVTTQRCADLCGQGTQSCTDGKWNTCEVPPIEGECENICGTGTRICDDAKWGECRVPPVDEPCTNLCGSGLQRCENGVVGACQVEIVRQECRSVCGPGHEACIDGSWQPCDAPLPKPPKLQVVIRDFKIEHPDFELPARGLNDVETGIVSAFLGPDDKPVYAGDPSLGTPSTTGAANFNQWYNDVPDVNMTAALAFDLASSPRNPAMFVYSDTDFFPIDGQYFGNEGNTHNFHFTLEAKTRFQYIGGEVFRFTGDDDMWVFINRRLAIDLGGLHQPRSSSVELDSIAGTHGLVIGQEYPLHFFFAERHTYESNFTLETTISEPGSCE